MKENEVKPRTHLGPNGSRITYLGDPAEPKPGYIALSEEDSAWEQKARRFHAHEVAYREYPQYGLLRRWGPTGMSTATYCAATGNQESDNRLLGGSEISISAYDFYRKLYAARESAKSPGIVFIDTTAEKPLGEFEIKGTIDDVEPDEGWKEEASMVVTDGGYTVTLTDGHTLEDLHHPATLEFDEDGAPIVVLRLRADRVEVL